MWQMLKVNGVKSKIIESGAELIVESRACIWVGMGVSECFLVNVGLRQHYVMSTWLLIVYMDGVVQEVNARVLEKNWNC